MAAAGVAAASLLLALATGAGAAAPDPCVGRYVLTRARGPLVRAPGDAVVLDRIAAVLDPTCGTAAIRTQRAGGRWRIAARWPGCRGAGTLRMTLRASADCTLLRGHAVAAGRRSRFVAITSTCGDRIVDTGRGERCDDGNTLDGDGCDATCGRCTSAGSFPATWDAVQAVFDRACAGCHGASATAGLDLRAPGSYERLLGVAAPDGSGRLLIAPGDRETSLVWLKIDKGTRGGADDLSGPGMPVGVPLSEAVVDALGRWIDAGAPRTGLVPSADALLAACAD